MKDKCEWKLKKHIPPPYYETEIYKTSCGYSFDENDYLNYEIFNFCPFCGKEIKESEFRP